MRVNEVYDRPTIQGEGPYTGRLCTFVRLYGCNLHCAWCDTPYTWDTTGRNGIAYSFADESQKWDVADVVHAVRELAVPLCIVSGGEPLIQYSDVLDLAKLLRPDVAVHVETNGTIPPRDEFTIEHYTVSPKLSTARSGNAIKPDALRLWARNDRASFKFVCSSAADVDEAGQLVDEFTIPRDRVWIMPEGRTRLEVDAHLRTIADHAIAQHFNISPRLHVQLWGNERGR